MLIFALPPVPHYGGTYICKSKQNFRRAKSEWHSKFPPGHWALGLQKLGHVRFPRRAWVFRTNAPDSKYVIPHPPPSGAPSPKGEGKGKWP